MLLTHSLSVSLSHTHTPLTHTLELLPSASLSRVQRSNTHSSLTQAHGNSDTTALSRNESTWMIHQHDIQYTSHNAPHLAVP